MSELLSKISSYNLYNYLLVGLYTICYYAIIPNLDMWTRVF